MGVATFFHEKFAFFQYSLVGGALGKLLENPEKPMPFHEMFVVGALARQ